MKAQFLERQASLPAENGGHGSPPHKVLEQLCSHASEDVMQEACGFIYETFYIPLPNVSETPNRFFADPRALARTLAQYGEPEMVFHTHPNGNLDLSLEDRRLWYYTNSTMMIGCMFEGHLRWKIYGKRGD